jgi:type II secretion system protein N
MVENISQTNLRDRLALGVLYTLFFAGVFCVSLYWTFPYERLRDYVMSQASSTTETSARNVQIGDIHPFGMTGVMLRDVEITQTSTEPDSQPSVLRFSELSAKLSPLSLLFGDKKLAFHAAAGGGKLDGVFTRGSDAQHVTAKLAAFDVAKAGLGSFIGLPLKGKASGSVDLSLATDVAKSVGTVKLELRGLHIGDGKAKIKVPALGSSGLTLDEVDAGKLQFDVDLKDGLATLTKFATDGRDLKLDGKGSARLVDPLKRSRLDLDLDLTFSDAYKNKSDRTKTIFEIIGMRPEWQRATTPSGAMRVHVGGTFVAIRGGPGGR